MEIVGIVGCGGFGREVMALLCEAARDALCRPKLVFVVTGPFASGHLVNGYPVLSEAEFFDTEGRKTFNVAIASSTARQAIADRFEQKGAIPREIRSKGASVFGPGEHDPGAIICSGSVISPNVEIGRFFHCNFHSYLAHDCSVGDFVTFGPRVTCNGNIVIEDHAYIGAGAVLRQGSAAQPLRIGKGAVIGMGAIVTKDVPAGETWVGNPARRIVK